MFFFSLLMSCHPHGYGIFGLNGRGFSSPKFMLPKAPSRVLPEGGGRSPDVQLAWTKEKKIALSCYPSFGFRYVLDPPPHSPYLTLLDLGVVVCIMVHSAVINQAFYGLTGQDEEGPVASLAFSSSPL